MNFDSKTIEMESEKKEVNSNEGESLMEFIPDIRPTQTPPIYHLVPDMQIKQEEVDFHHNATSHSDSDDHFDMNVGTVSSTPHVDCSAVSVNIKAEKKNLNEFYLHLFRCQEDCETCQLYLRMLSEHVRSTHAPGPSQSTQNPLHIEHTEESSIQLKCEVDENVDKMDCSQEDSRLNSESDPHIQSQSQGEKIRSSQERFKCDVCDKIFKTKYILNSHKRVHTGERPHKCDVCEMSFSRSTHLTRHKITHSGEKPYECTVCKKHFSQLTSLTIHKRLHTVDAAYKCEECEISFSAKCALTLHKRLHTGETPYKCDDCEKSFSNKGALSVHKKRVHIGERPYKCDLCEKKFARSGDLARHKKIHTKPDENAVCKERVAMPDLLMQVKKRVQRPRKNVHV